MKNLSKDRKDCKDAKDSKDTKEELRSALLVLVVLAVLDVLDEAPHPCGLYTDPSSGFASAGAAWGSGRICRRYGWTPRVGSQFWG